MEQDTPHVGATPSHPEELNGHHEGATTPLVAPGIHHDLTGPFLRRERATAQSHRRMDRHTSEKVMPRAAKATKETAKANQLIKCKKTAAFGCQVNAINQLPIANSYTPKANRAQYPGNLRQQPLPATPTPPPMMTPLQ